ncbi:UDP-3-O-acyl-N-acetylglucosamine deacetylase [Falsihalocynthiibacter arcticus]|uniref:UDP-3-O-acyl-N-acetylglucosamine deacetylase n=1 Tax=Falsihalocynthiibacter arcticus TaxID=1579316 RepID=A0A126V4L7_9RHOB|nr:UDP-3-O-acyl-N-acetylglucosamine deacetylase [Falsihalocynthiibacter arcticus]AML53254.1 UDP-3-O-[3-hydroxymyristoyl] N-acetylglucosamine deacetylase [Falsihalocynthiibacter arcticus]
MQTTLNKPITFRGIGLHSGAPVRMVVKPAAVDSGIWFVRSDLEGDNRIPALYDATTPAQLCTRVANASGASVSTIEHIMAALAGCGVQNAVIDVDGPEIPVLDGSSAEFVTAILMVGRKDLNAPIRALKILKTVEVRDGDAIARIEPAKTLHIDFHIRFNDAAIGKQDKKLSMANGAFVRELCDSRTFCRQSDVDAMRAAGLALGGSVKNAVVIDGDDVLTPGGLRHRDEAVRHKMLDALGDLALAGGPILGRYTGIRAGHALTNKLLRAIFADANAWEWVKCDARVSARLPGAGLHATDIPIAAE